MRVLLTDAAGRRRHELVATGEDGRTEAEVETERFSAHVLPKRLQAEQRWPALLVQPDPLADAYLAIGEVHAKQGTKTEVELRLPPEWHH